MKITSNLTHVATEIEFEAPLNEEELLAVFEKSGVQGFPAELDIAERTEDHVQMLSLEKLLGFAKASGLSAVTYDVTYFPHADDAEVAYQLRQLARDLEISAEVIRDVCAAEIQERTLDVARYLAAELKEMGIFEIYEDASHIPIVCWGLKDDADVEWSLYDLSDRLRMSGWLVPAYPMPADMQDTTVQRVVARADFSMQLCIKLVEDMKKEMDTLNKAKFVTGNTQGVIQTGFNHGGRSAVDKGEKVQTKAKSNQ